VLTRDDNGLPVSKPVPPIRAITRLMRYELAEVHLLNPSISKFAEEYHSKVDFASRLRAAFR
jgi:hypothetical protein